MFKTHSFVPVIIVLILYLLIQSISPFELIKPNDKMHVEGYPALVIKGLDEETIRKERDYLLKFHPFLKHQILSQNMKSLFTNLVREKRRSFAEKRRNRRKISPVEILPVDDMGNSLLVIQKRRRKLSASAATPACVTSPSPTSEVQPAAVHDQSSSAEKKVQDFENFEIIPIAFIKSGSKTETASTKEATTTEGTTVTSTFTTSATTTCVITTTPSSTATSTTTVPTTTFVTTAAVAPLPTVVSPSPTNTTANNPPPANPPPANPSPANSPANPSPANPPPANPPPANLPANPPPANSPANLPPANSPLANPPSANLFPVNQPFGNPSLAQQSEYNPAVGPAKYEENIPAAQAKPAIASQDINQANNLAAIANPTINVDDFLKGQLASTTEETYGHAPHHYESQAFGLEDEAKSGQANKNNNENMSIPEFSLADSGSAFKASTKTDILKDILDNVEEIRQQGGGGSNMNEDLQCQINGTWISKAGQMVLNITLVNGSYHVALQNCTPNKTPEKTFLTNKNWTINASIPFPKDEMVILHGIHNQDKRVAIFVGECRVCSGSEAITGQWLVARVSKDCKDQKAAQELIGDVWRRDALQTLRKDRLNRLKAHTTHTTSSKCSCPEGSTTSAPNI